MWESDKEVNRQRKEKERKAERANAEREREREIVRRGNKWDRLTKTQKMRDNYKGRERIRKRERHKDGETITKAEKG